MGKCKDCGRVILPETGDCFLRCAELRRPSRRVVRSQRGAKPQREAVFSEEERRRISQTAAAVAPVYSRPHLKFGRAARRPA